MTSAQRATYTLHVVSHVRWPRERILSRQTLRLRFVSLMDALLDLLETEPRYRHFMLDGQTILIEDYLSLRPERYDALETHIREGQLLIGPWYVQPDPFLSSPETHLRNLLIGMGTARVFGAAMKVGYLPGNIPKIGQLPQILRGFGLDAAVVVSGLGDEPAELFWEAPDGSRVLLAYVRDGDVLKRLPLDAVEVIRRARENLAPHAATGHLLILNGGEYLAAMPGLSDVISDAARALPDTVFHSSLPDYFELIRSETRDLSVVRGELRSPMRHPIRQGTFSARLPIKQRNHAAENLLTQWVEPFAAWAELQGAETPATLGMNVEVSAPRLNKPQTAIGRAWRLLLENSDGLNGAVSDAVVADMNARFDEVLHIGEEITQGALNALAASVDTSALNGDGAALIVFNPSSTARTDLLDVMLDVPGQFENGFKIIDARGQLMYFTLYERDPVADVARLTLDRDGLHGAQAAIQNGRLLGFAPGDVYARRSGETLTVIVTITDGEPTLHTINQLAQLAETTHQDESLQTVELRFRRPMTYHLKFTAPNVPPFGYTSYGLILPEKAPAPLPDIHTPQRELSIENAYLRATLDPNGPTITLVDKARGLTYAGLLKFESEGDQGDALNFSPIGRAIQINRRLDAEGLLEIRGEHADRLCYAATLTIDAAPEMEPASAELITLRIDVELMLLRDVPRLDVRLMVHNTLANHRLRAFFPLPFAAEAANYDGHFEIINRPVQDLPAISPPDGWAETPLSAAPQRAFIAAFAPQPPSDPLSGDESYALTRPGLLVGNRGLPEAEIIFSENGNTEIAVTVLRSVNWLSRADVATRARNDQQPMRADGLAMIGSYDAELSIIPSDSRTLNYTDGWAFSEGSFRAALTTIDDGSLPSSISLIRSSASIFRISAVKLPEDSARDGIIVRGCNMSDEPLTITLTPWRAFSVVDVVRLDETETGGRLAVEADGSIEFKAAPHRILTFWFHDSLN